MSSYGRLGQSKGLHRYRHYGVLPSQTEGLIHRRREVTSGTPVLLSVVRELWDYYLDSSLREKSE